MANNESARRQLFWSPATVETITPTMIDGSGNRRDPFFFEISPSLSKEVLNTPISGSGHTVSAANDAV